jgi:Na+-translocating ferredoxin:NAD+ oxidoreductase RnfA subunit
MAAFALTSAMLFGIRERVSWSDIRADWKGFPLMLVALGLVFVALYAADVSWWLSEVFR